MHGFFNQTAPPSESNLINNAHFGGGLTGAACGLAEFLGRVRQSYSPQLELTHQRASLSHGAVPEAGRGRMGGLLASRVTTLGRRPYGGILRAMPAGLFL